MCLCVCTGVPACVPVFVSRLPPPELGRQTVEQVWILQLDHISERDTSDNGAEFFTVESSTIATSNKAEERGLVFGWLFLAYGMVRVDAVRRRERVFRAQRGTLEQTCFRELF